MESRGTMPIRRKDKILTAILVLVLALLPYPAGRLALEMPPGWFYILVYVGGAAFAVFLSWFRLGKWSTRVSKQPHRRLMYAVMGATLVWYALTAAAVVNVDRGLAWLIFNLLGIWVLLEAMLAKSVGLPAKIW